MQMLYGDLLIEIKKFLSLVDMVMLESAHSIKTATRTTLTRTNISYYAAAYGSLKWFSKFQYTINHLNRLYNVAIANGNLKVVTYIRDTYGKMNAKHGLLEAATKGCIDTLCYMQRYPGSRMLKRQVANAVIMSGHNTVIAAHGDSACFILSGMHNNTILTGHKNECIACVIADNIELLKKKYIQGADYLLKIAAKFGSIRCFKYLFNDGRNIFNYLVIAAKYGRLEILKYIYAFLGSWVFGVSGPALYQAAVVGGIECFLYVHTTIFNNSNEYITRDVYSKAGKYGNLKILKSLCNADRGKNWDTELCRECAAAGHLECIKYIHAFALSRGINIPWDETAILEAIVNSKISVAKYLYHNGCPQPDICYLLAAICTSGKIKYLSIFKDKIGQGFQYDVCYEATLQGKLEFIRAMYNTYPNEVLWDTTVCIKAVAMRHTDIIKYIYKKGSHECVPILWKEIYIKSVKKNALEIRKFLCKKLRKTAGLTAGMYVSLEDFNDF